MIPAQCVVEGKRNISGSGISVSPATSCRRRFQPGLELLTAHPATYRTVVLEYSGLLGFHHVAGFRITFLFR